ncbi:MAG: methyltransferase [Defluviitaleaceae bacterium]|nr:methyltransferase [Defluviitaleaceae bacterium]MCL2240202.1 methyltransferase [Defluviitaleaceae bacterium]
MRHYFIANPDLPTDERVLPVRIFGREFHFVTTSGLFSYEKPDAASLLLLEVIQSTQPPLSGALLDLGCGYGLLGIVLAKAHAREDARLTLSDTNAIACAYAERNAKKNNVSAKIIHSDGFAAMETRFHAIVHNPPIHAGKDTLYRLYEEAATNLHPGGALYLVIQKKHGAESTLAFLNPLFHQVKILYKRKGYFVLRCEVRA